LISRCGEGIFRLIKGMIYVNLTIPSHARGRPYHPQTQGRIERWHRSMKNQILLNNYYLPGELRVQLQQFVDHYNHERYHESLDNLTPADVFYGRGQAILDQREKIKLNTLAMRRKMHYDKQVNLHKLMNRAVS
jgi:putative transposase